MGDGRCALFYGLTYDPFDERDDFFSDRLRRYSTFCVEDDRLLAYDEFEAEPATNSALAPVFAFFSGLFRGEDRYRWDRMVGMHLLLMAFLNVFGYKHQQRGADGIARVASMVQNPRVLVNLIRWLPKHDPAATGCPTSDREHNAVYASRLLNDAAARRLTIFKGHHYACGEGIKASLAGIGRRKRRNEGGRLTGAGGRAGRAQKAPETLLGKRAVQSTLCA